MNNILICGLSSLLISMFYYFYLSSNCSSIDNEKIKVNSLYLYIFSIIVIFIFISIFTKNNDLSFDKIQSNKPPF